MSEPRQRVWVDGPPTEEMVRLRDRSMGRLTPESEGRWASGDPAEGRLMLAQGAWESGWDAAVLAARAALLRLEGTS